MYVVRRHHEGVDLEVILAARPGDRRAKRVDMVDELCGTPLVDSWMRDTGKRSCGGSSPERKRSPIWPRVFPLTSISSKSASEVAAIANTTIRRRRITLR